MESLITLLFVAVTATTFAIAALYTPRDRLLLLLMLALPFCLTAMVLLMSPVYVASLMNDPLGHALVTASMVMLGVFLVRNINHIQV